MQTLESNLITFESTYSDFFDVSMIVVLHLTHSPMLLHIQMIIGNFSQSP